jgi:ATP-binding cassette subfamily B protein
MGFGPMGGNRMPAEKAKDFSGTVRRLLRYLKPQVPKLAAVFVFAVASTFFLVKAPKITGDAVNQLTDGFIAKSTVNSVSKIQDKIDPQIREMLDRLEQGKNGAVKQTDAAVEKKFSETVAARKRQAYAQAVKKAGSVVGQKFRSAVSARKQQAYAQATQKADAVVGQQFGKEISARKQQADAQAVQKADAAAEQQFEKEIASRKQQAYAEAVQKADALFAGLPMTPALEQQKLRAETQAKAAVDAEFAKQQPEMQAQLAAAKKTAEAQAKAAVAAAFAKQRPEMQAQLAAAKKTAEAQAKAAVDAAFAKQQPEMQAQLAAAKKTAEAQAKAAVDAAFAKQQPEMQAQLAAAKKTAEAQAKAAVGRAVLEKAKLTQGQFDVLKAIAAVPNVKTIRDSGQKADAVRRMFDLGRKLPSEYTKKLPSISRSDLDKGIDAVRKYGGAIPFGAIRNTLAWLLAVFALGALCMFAMQFIMSDVAQKTVFILRREVDEKLGKLPLNYFDSHSNGDILSRMTNDIDTISSTLQQSLTQIITSLFQIIGYIWMMVSINLVLTLIVLATLPLYLAATLFITKHSQKYYASQQKFLGRLSGHTEEMFTGHVIVKAYGHEKDSVETFRAVNKELYGSGWKAQFLSGIMMPLMNFIGNVGYVLIAVVGGIFVTRSYLNLGDIVSFISYAKSFSQPIIMTANIANIIQSTVACAERVFELLDEKEQIPDAEDAVVLDRPRGDIRFEHVRFRYRENVPLIEDMNLDVRQGGTVAIVGPTGAGKTTLVNLLMRFYEIGGGKLTFDGVDIRRIRRGNLRTMFGMVLQDTWLFHGTIRDNIAYGRENASEEEIVTAAKAAHADRFVRSLPQGYDTVLNEEASNISQGQKQLLTIARALLADPAVLILDEATSNVDTRTEVLIQKAMKALMKGRTNFVIAHRLSTIRDAQTILVMDHGAIVEKGTHRSLLAKGGFYAELYNSQFAGRPT